MKIRFSTDDVLPSIAQCVGVVNAKNVIPILSNLLLETFNDGMGGCALLVTASDNETWVSVKAALTDGEKGMKICVAATDFFKALSNLKGKVVEMEVDESRHVITCTHEEGHFMLPYVPTDEYPSATKVVDGEDYVQKTINAERLLASIEKGGCATGNDELRPIMSGMRLDFMADGLVSVSTDGHKMVKFKDKSIKTEGIETSTMGFTLPKKPANILLNILGGCTNDVKLTFNDATAEFTNGAFKLTTRLIEGRYPNYDTVIPKDNDIIIDADKGDFITALKRVIPMSNTSSEMIRVDVARNVITLVATDIDFSKGASERIACDYTGENFSIGFKGSTLLTILQNIDGDKVRLAFKEPNRAGVFKPATEDETTEYVSILMPMLLNEV